MGDLVLKGATSGQITLSPVGTAGTNTLTLPAKTGNIITSADSGTVTQTMLGTNVAGNGPTFSAYQSSAQAALSAATWTKLLFQTEDYDTNNNFASSTFTPTVAGYYLITGNMQINGSTSSVGIEIYKGPAGSLTGVKRNYLAATGLSSPSVFISAIISLNGTTDTVELYGYTGTSLAPVAGSAFTSIAGSLLRAA